MIGQWQELSVFSSLRVMMVATIVDSLFIK